MLVSITTANYIKRIDLDTYREQRRGGKGITGMTTKEEDFVDSIFVAGDEGLPALLHEHRQGLLAQGLQIPRARG